MSEFLDVGGVHARIAAFDKEHGANIYDEGWFRFANGACRESNPLGILVDPPTDAFDRAKRIALYYKIIFERAVRAFDRAKNDYRAMAQMNLNSPVCGAAPAVGEATVQLTALKTAAQNAKAKYDEALANVEATRSPRLRANERQNQMNQDENRQLLNRIDKIEI